VPGRLTMRDSMGPLGGESPIAADIAPATEGKSEGW